MKKGDHNRAKSWKSWDIASVCVCLGEVFFEPLPNAWHHGECSHRSSDLIPQTSGNLYQQVRR